MADTYSLLSHVQVTQLHYLQNTQIQIPYIMYLFLHLMMFPILHLFHKLVRGIPIYMMTLLSKPKKHT